MKALSEAVDILMKFGYVSVQLKDHIIEGIKLLPLGRILSDNIRKEWLQGKDKINTYLVPSSGSTDNVLPDVNILDILKSENFRESFMYVKHNFQKELPMAIKQEINFSSNRTLNFTSNININTGRLLSSNYFFNETSADEFFYKIQRERKIWWMRISTNPGRYFLMDLKSETIKNYKTQSVKIASKFGFGDLELERIQLIPLKALDLENVHQFSLKDARIDKRVIPAIIRSDFCLETAMLGLLLDSIEGGKHRKLSIHRKITPYQCSLFCLSEDEKILIELQELATHLANVMRKSGISVLNLHKCYLNNEKALQKEISDMDKIGVAYSIILEHSSLKDGLMKLRSRDTSISEVIHITDVPDYLVKIVNS